MDGQYWIFSRGVEGLDNAVGRLSAPESTGKTQSGRFRLTQREMVVLHAVASGRANKEIARQFCISEQTVKHHVTNIFNKTGASSRLELTLFAIEHGLVETPPLQ